LSQVLAVRGFNPVHDRGRVLTDVAVAIGCGGRDLVDVEALRVQQQIFGPVASDTTAGRALGEVGERRRSAIAAARAAARAHVWGQLPGEVTREQVIELLRINLAEMCTLAVARRPNVYWLTRQGIEPYERRIERRNRRRSQRRQSRRER
jgi:hypothetical protein